MATTSVQEGGNWARALNVILGIWLFISAFVWPHTASEQTNTWILAILIVLASLVAMYISPVRYLNSLFAIYLFFSTWLMHHENVGTLWNNLIVAVVVFIVSLVPSQSMRSFGHRTAHA